MLLCISRFPTGHGLEHGCKRVLALVSGSWYFKGLDPMQEVVVSIGRVGSKVSHGSVRPSGSIPSPHGECPFEPFNSGECSGMRAGLTPGLFHSDAERAGESGGGSFRFTMPEGGFLRV